MLQRVLQQLGEDEGQRGRDGGRQQPEFAGKAGLDPGLGRGDLRGHHRHPAGDVIEVNDLVRGVRECLVDDGDRAHPAHRLLEGRPRLRCLEPARLQPQQRGHGLQVVLDPVMDLPDRGVLGDQFPLPVPQLGHVPEQDQRAGSRAANHERDRTQLNDRAVALHLGLHVRPAARRQHQRVVARPAGRAQPRGQRPELGSHEVGRQPEPAIGRQPVRARVRHPSRPAEPEQPVPDPGRPDQGRLLARAGENAGRHHLGHVVGCPQVGEIHPARRPGGRQVRGPLDDRDDPVLADDRDGLVADRNPGRPLRVAFPADPAFLHGHVEERPGAGRPHGADHVVGDRRGRRHRADLGECHPAGAVVQLRPQHQVGEGQVGQQLPVGQQHVQPVDVGLGQPGLAQRKVGQGRHAAIIASAAAWPVPLSPRAA